MRPPEQLSLEQVIARAASAGPIARNEAVAVFLEALRVAADADAVPDAASALLAEEGTLSYPPPAASEPRDPTHRVRSACGLAMHVFGAAQLDPPLALATASDTAPERFPTLRHLRDAFELELLLSGTPPPSDIERRMALAALMAKARQPREAAVAAVAPARAPTVAPSAPSLLESPLPFAIDPSARITEPSPSAPPPVAVRWLVVAGAVAIALVVGAMLMRARSPLPEAAARPATAALAPEIALPEVSAAREPPAVADARPQERPPLAPPDPSVRPDPPARPTEAAPRSLRNLRRHFATPDPRAPARAKLQLGDESLKQGRFFEAVIAFREALEQDPPLPVAARRLGDAYRSHQDDELAIAAYERYLDLEPQAPDADEVRAAVEELRSSTPVAR
jgi:Tetratricopeptide repeat